MKLEEFVVAFGEQFDETPIEEITPSTRYRELSEWSSLVALSVISMVDEEMQKQLTGAELRSASTIEDLFNVLEAK